MKNKEVIDKLTEYFQKQTSYNVCRLLANMMIDFKRISEFQTLTIEEKNSLSKRINLNTQQLYNFILVGSTGELKLDEINSEEE